MGYSLADIAIVYHDMEQYDKGVEYAKNGLKIIREFSEASPRTTAFAINSLAINFDDWNMPDSALFYHYQVFDLYPDLDSAEFTTETINELRDTIWAMNKDSISVEDLQGRIAGLLEKVKRACPQTRFELEVDEGFDLTSALNSLEGINYYRIAQEAINNAIKHSEAKNIKITLSSNPTGLGIAVSDDGKGLNNVLSSGNGLRNMKTRAERIGREFLIDFKEGKGTVVQVY